jgi:queuine/archaeosine tRNA-ribosyltransferase
MDKIRKSILEDSYENEKEKFFSRYKTGKITDEDCKE